MAIIRWLHLSDLHFGYDDFTVKEFRKKLPDKLKEYTDRNQVSFDYIFVTGDLRYAKSKNNTDADYTAAVKYLDGLCESADFNAHKPKVMLVPGNHDVSILEGSERMRAIKETQEKYQTRIGKIDPDNLQKLKPSESFLHAFQQITNMDFVDNHTLHKDEEINILCLDTSLVCTKSSVDYKALLLGMDSVQNLLQDAKADKPLIILAHHSFDWFETREGESLLNLLIDHKACAYLCGHIHTEAISELRRFSRPDETLSQFIAPTSMDQDEKGKQTTTMGFLIGQIDTETREGRVTFYKWDMDDSKIYERETVSLTKNASKFFLPCTKGSELINHLRKQFEKVKKQSGSYILNEISRELFPSLQSNVGRIYTSEKDKEVPLFAYIQDIWSVGSHNHLLITGEGGIGKTVTLLETCGELLKKDIPTLYLQLHNLKNTDIEAYIEKRIFPGNTILMNEFMRLINQESTDHPNVVLLLDGFNEVAEKNVAAVLNDIKVWWKEYPGLQLILTSRYDMRAYFPIFTNAEHLKVAPLNSEQITNYLALREIPIPNDSILQLLNYPLMLNLYVCAEGYLSQNEMNAVLRWKQTESSAGVIIWNFLQSQIQKSAFDEDRAQNILDYIIAVEYLLPYIGWRMEKSEKYAVDRRTLQNWVENGMEYFQTTWNNKGKLPQRIIDIKYDYPSDIWEWRAERIFRVLTQELHLVNINKDRSASFIHQEFRDCLSAIFLIKEIEERQPKEIPKSWSNCISTYVCDFISNLIERQDIDRLWDTLRNLKIQQGNFTMYNVYEIYRRILFDDFSEVDFSNQDIRNISLCNMKLTNKNGRTSFNRAIVGPYTFIFAGHTFIINSIACLPEGRRCVSGSLDHTIKIWDIESGQCLRTLEGHTETFTCVACLPDGKRCVSGSKDNTIKIWDIESGQCLCTLEGHTDTITCVACLPDGKRCVSGSNDYTIKIWNIESGQCLRTLKAYYNGITSVACLPDGKRLVSGSCNSISLWNIESGHYLRTLEGHTDTITCMACLPDGKRCVSGSNDYTIKIWDIESGQCLCTLGGHTNAITSVACLPDGKRCVSSSRDDTIKI
ncbi:MAG: metallophosphoesterase, partial [Eubacteriales bacterium]|nr:metallophosphoesterase [Eubacteriales bacterium]